MASLRAVLSRISGGTCCRTMRLGGVAVAVEVMLCVGTSWLSFGFNGGAEEPFVGTLVLSTSDICHVPHVCKNIIIIGRFDCCYI